MAAVLLLAACGGGGGGDSSTPPATAPTISTQPQSATVTIGQTASFSVTAAGSAPLSYQWTKNGTAISGATTASYTTPSTVAGDNGSAFAVTVTNSAGNITSSNAILTVSNPAPSITAQPQNTAVATGATAAFAVTASSPSALSYQWQKNGATISGGPNTASYATPAVTANDAGSEFDVLVSNGASSVTSATALLGVNHTLGVVAGALGGIGHSDTAGPASNASFYAPAAVATDAAGNVYVADGNNNTIRKITPAGAVSTFVGTAGASGSTDGTGAAARFNSPGGLAVDAAGNVYVADTGNDTIRVITTAGVVTTLAGSPGLNGSGNGTGAAAHFDGPAALVVNSAGTVLYVADANNQTVRKIVVASAVVTTFAGTPGTSGSKDGVGAAALFNYPSGIALDATGDNLYVVDTFNCTLRKIVVATQTVSTIAGTAGDCSAADGTGAAALFNYPASAALDSTAANLYVSDTLNYTVRQVALNTQAVTTLAGSAGNGGATDGTGSQARFAYPVGAAVDAHGNIYVADSTVNLVRQITAAGVVSTYAGNLGGLGYKDGTTGLGGTARFNNPHNIALGPSGIIYVADETNDVIRQIADGQTTTLAGSIGSVGSADGAGTSAQFDQPFGMAVDSHGNLFVADSANDTIRKITPAGVVSTFAGTAGSSGSADGQGAAARFNSPMGLAIDSTDNLYVADCQNETVRKVTSAGAVTTIAGQVGTTGSADGSGTKASFNCPHGLAVNTSSGVLYVADRFNDTIRRIDTSGNVSTIAGSAGANDFIDGNGVNAHFSWPGALAVDAASGTVYVTDYLHHSIRKIAQPDSTAVVTTVVGIQPSANADPVGVVPGMLPGALSGPTSIAVVPGSSTELIFSDALENSILLATLP
jgi:DNA-binding beta-propeller fold protein YncE